jgi:acetate kinase
MTILTLNIGSTNIKYSIFKGEDNFEEIEHGKVLEIKDLQKKIDDFKILKVLMRIVYWPDLDSPILEINEDFLEKFKSLQDHAPLHNPNTLLAIEQIKILNTGIKLYGVFDAYFHNSKDKSRSFYPIDIEMQENFKIKKLGFHGISVGYIVKQFKKDSNLIVCHLGGGCSVTAIKNGKSIANSMGFGTEEGLMMVKRAGGISVNLSLFIKEKLNLSDKELREHIYTKSGFYGICKTENIKEIVDNQTNKNNKLALDLFVNSIIDYIGSYYFALEGNIDYLVLTGGIGENSIEIKNIIEGKIKFLDKNLEIKVIKTNEEREMIEIFKIFYELKLL